MKFAKEMIKKHKDENQSTSLCTLKMEKNTVLQRARVFNDTNIKPKSCINAITQLIFILEQGTTLTSDEATSVFFSITKLFQFHHPVLRRLAHVAIKILSARAHDCIIATSSLLKDMTGSDQFIRASAIRAICAIADSGTLPGIERYVKQAIVDSNSCVASAAIVSSLNFISISSDILKRFLNQFNEFSQNETIVHYHALGLMYLVKHNDRIAILKLFQTFYKAGLKNTPSAIMLIRIAVRLFNETNDKNDSELFLEFIKTCLHSRSETVIFEACRALIIISQTNKCLINVVSSMRILLSSRNSVARHAALSVLSMVASISPPLLHECSVDLESMLSDSNKSLATSAASVLLKIGSESNLERTINMVISFIPEISESFRVEIVKELKMIVLKFPAKAKLFIEFAGKMFRQEDGVDCKTVLVDLVVGIIQYCPDQKEKALQLLCEFIEDCEFTSLLKRVLNIITNEGPECPNPSHYLRFIYNRIVLEEAEVRAVAVVSLAQFAVKVPSLKPSILILLQRCFSDPDDEVRERAYMYYSMLSNKPNCSFIIQVPKISIGKWKLALDLYISRGITDKPFNQDCLNEINDSVPSTRISSVEETSPEITIEDKISPSSLDLICDETGLNPSTFSHVTTPQHLTEDEAEFDVHCFKHVFLDNIVFEFLIKNTLDDMILTHARISMNAPSEFSILNSTKCSEILSNGCGRCFVTIKLPQNPTYISEIFQTTMLYLLQEAKTEEKYVLDNLELTVSDHFKSHIVDEFDNAWEDLGEDNEAEETCALDTFNSIADASAAVINMLGLTVCQSTDMKQHAKKSYRMLLSGKYRDKNLVLAILELKFGHPPSILLKLTLRCTDPAITENLFSVFS